MKILRVSSYALLAISLSSVSIGVNASTKAVAAPSAESNTQAERDYTDVQTEKIDKKSFKEASPGTPTTSSANSEVDKSLDHKDKLYSAATIRSLQKELMDKGYKMDRISGTLDDSTKQAIRKYQKDKNLEVTGNLNSSTLTSLGIEKSEAKTEVYSE